MNSSQLKSYVASAALNVFPPRLQSAILEDDSFVSQWDIPVTSIITIGSKGPSFENVQFLKSVRASMKSTGIRIPLEDTNSNIWHIVASIKNAGLSFVVECNHESYLINDHTVLSDDYSVRSNWFEQVSSEVCLGNSLVKKWRSRLESAPLSDHDFSKLTHDLAETPVSFYQNLKDKFKTTSINISSLVPTSKQYFEQLVGSIPVDIGVIDFIENHSVRLIEYLQYQNTSKGLLFSLFQCSCSGVSQHIKIENMDRKDLVDFYNSISNFGDMISQIGAIEVALSNLGSHPELEQFAEKMINNMLKVGQEDTESHFGLISALIVLVDSEISRRRILANSPPYFRRHAAIAQSSLIASAFLDSKSDIKPFVQWLDSVSTKYIFFLQNQVDLRVEPRWLPDFASSAQLRAEFIGRIRNAASKFGMSIRSETLRELLFGEHSEFIDSDVLPLWALPGPLEGSIAPSSPVPTGILEQVTKALKSEKLDSSTLTLLANVSFLFSVPSDSAELAATALRRAKYLIEGTRDHEHLYSLLWSIAVLAAVTRTTTLAKELRIVTRIMRRRAKLGDEQIGELRIAMISAAAFVDKEEWAQFTGEWITEIAFEIVPGDLARQTYISIVRLVSIEPALAPHCAAADAALRSLLPIQQLPH